MKNKLLEAIGDKDVLDKVNNGNIHEIIEQEFSDYFVNKENLKRYSKDFLIQDWININKNEINKKKDIINLLNCYYEALRTNEEVTLTIFAEFQNITAKMSKQYWSICNLQEDFSELESYDYTVACFKLIEDVSELLLKNFFVLLISINRVLKNKEVNLRKIQTLKFGNMYNELYQSEKFSFLFSGVKSNVSISQWRNIACHKAYEYSKGKIKCYYGENNDKEVIINTKEELLELTKSIYLIFQIINLSFKFFTYDYIYEIKPYFDKCSNIEENRKEDWQLIFTTELLAYGYIVKDIYYNDDESISVKIQETTDEDIDKRAIQSTLSIYKAWFYSNLKNIEVIYYDKLGMEYLIASSTADICEKIDSGEKDISYLAENMSIRLL